jgi:hypothetical protein
MAHHRYKTHEELVNTSGVTCVSDDKLGIRTSTYTLGGRPNENVIVDLDNSNFLGKKIDFAVDQHFADWFCVFVPDEEVKVSPPEESKIGISSSGYTFTASPGFVYNPEKNIKSSIEDTDLKFRCLEAASIYNLKEGVSIIDMAEKIYKFVKQ